MSSIDNDEQYPGNSYMEAQRKTTITKIDSEETKPQTVKKPLVKGREKKKSFAKRFAESFFIITKEDIEEKLLTEWLVPGIKNMIEDAVHMVLFGGKSRAGYRKDENGNRLRVVSYDKAYDDNRSRGVISPRRNRKPELIFDTRDDADTVLETLFEYLEDYHRVTVKDLYTLADMPTDYTMNDWGWYDLSSAKVIRVEEGFLLDMPKVEVIKRR